MSPFGSNRALTLVVSAAVAVASLVFFSITLDLSGDWSGDEAHKVAETYFLRLALDGDFAHPDWFATPVARTNPHLGKWIFGLAILAGGEELPTDPEARWTGSRFLPPEGREEQYGRMLKAARLVSLVSVAAIAGILTWLSLRACGPLAAGIAIVLLFRHFLTITVARTAIFDALQALVVLVSAIPLWMLWRTRDERLVRSITLGALAGIACAIAFQVRLNGFLALLSAWLIIGAASRLRGVWDTIRLLAVVTIAFFVGATALNPFYWSAPRSGSNIAVTVAPDTLLLVRPVHRYAAQYRDVQAVMASVPESMRLRGVRARFVYFGSIAFSGIAGKLIAIGWLTALASVLARRDRARLVFGLLWAGTLALATALWLPLAWEKYVFVTMPGLILVAAFGWSSLLSRALATISGKRRNSL
ncbi:MAG TPA: hypothetical protein VMT00_13645 [Thermoanaerobaculia bacterium]|nr:hypothetical protein [Thermoanaerobaculia bacterium]